MRLLQPSVRVKVHHNNLAIVEEKPIKLAVIPTNNPLFETIMVRPVSPNGNNVSFDISSTVLVHPRYVKQGMQHEIIEVYGYRNGRSIDILLEEPLSTNGEQYGILNVKGTGANADREMLFDPLMWFVPAEHTCKAGTLMQTTWRWDPIEVADAIEKRTWGAVHTQGSTHEFYNSVLPDNGIPQYPHLTINHMPTDLNTNIMELGHATHRIELSQITRAFATNIRLGSDILALAATSTFDGSHFITPGMVAAHVVCYFILPDTKVINAQLRLAHYKKMITTRGHIADNRFIDGTFTDADNFKLEVYNLEDAVHFLKYVLSCTINELIKDSADLKVYLEVLEVSTKLEFTKILTGNLYDALENLLVGAFKNP